MTEAHLLERLKRASASLPGVEPSTWHGTPSLKVAGKSFCRINSRIA